MSRRAGGNNIRGPTSALTSFLRDAGITHATVARRAATQQQSSNRPQQPAAGPSTQVQTNQAEAGTSSPRPSRPSRAASRRASGYGSDNLDEDEDENDKMDEDTQDEVKEEAVSTPPPTKKRKLTKAQEAKLKAQEKKKMKGKKGKGNDDSDYDDDDDDPYTALSKSMFSNSISKPPAGSFENCAKCGKQFTVTKYTMAANPPPGWLCHLCAKSSGQDPFKKPAAPKKRGKTAADKREVIHFIENRLPSLVNLCIKIVTKHIEDVESLGDIGALNLEAIAKAMSKNRSLTAENATLFYNTTNKRLTFYDATNLTSSGFQTLAFLNPNLTSLRLDFCGQLDDASFKVFATSLPALMRIELVGPFLVRTAAWKEFAVSHPNLEGFLITQSPRFDLDCMQTLVEHCPGIKELRLKEFAKMSDEFLQEITAYKDGLVYLDISCPGGGSCSEPALVDLLAEVGPSLQGLDVSKHDALTDEFLNEGLIPHVHSLESLNLSHLPELTDDGVARFFEEWQNPPLVNLDLSRNPELKGPTLQAVMKHSGKKLEVLSINGFKEVDEPSLRTIGRLGKELRKLDVGFCRELDDFVVKAWFEGEEVNGVMRGGCPNLQELKVWGCNRLTEKCPKKAGVTVHGVESHILRMN